MTASTDLKPLQLLFGSKRGRLLPLPPRLTRLYGTFRMPSAGSRPQIFSNFVSTMDGVVSLQAKGHSAGGDISGFSIQDRMVMGLLRAVADVVIVGSGTLDADRRHVWTPEAICPPLATDYQRLRRAMAKDPALLNVVVTASGNIDLRSPVFASGRVRAMIVTTPTGAKRLARQGAPDCVEIRVVRRVAGEIRAHAIVEEVMRTRSGNRILVEGGPRLLGSFYSEGLIDEQFLTLAPQIAGRMADDGRLSLVMGRTFAPRAPLWGTLTEARRGDNLLFLRYSFD
ncbi:MAG: dihydrofolate reductase family protein [Gammaproteobacteria bacterium]